MALFSYRAARTDGTVERAELAGASEADVVRALQGRGLVPLEVKPAGQRRRWWSRGTSGRIQLQLLYESLAALIEAGLPLASALEQLTRTELAGPQAASMLEKWLRAVRDGQTFADAIADDVTILGPLALATVRAGERSGELAASLRFLGADAAQRDALQNALLGALFYPLILLFTALISLGIMLQFVVPRFAALFADAGVALPFATQLVLTVSNWLNHYGWVVPLLALLAYLFVKWLVSSPLRHQQLDEQLLRLPGVGAGLRALEAARFCRTLALLLRAGVAVPEALPMSADACNNRGVRAGLTRAGTTLRGGAQLAEAVRAEGLFPPLVTDLIAVGESSGQLRPMLEQLAVLHEAQVQRRLQRAVVVLEPALIVGLGLVIGGIIVSIMLAVLKMNALGQLGI